MNLPLRQAWIGSLVEKKLMMNAIALYVTAFNLARILGPAAAGFIMDRIGVGACYLINAGLFFCALFGLFFVSPVVSDTR